MTPREPTRHGYSYEEREKAEVGPTHRASWRSRSRKASRRHTTLVEELSASRADTRGGGSEMKSVREARVRHQPRGRTRQFGESGQPGRSGHDGRRSDRCTRLLRKGRRGGGLGRAGQRVACAARRVPRQLPTGLVAGEAVLARRRRTSETGDDHGEGCPSRRGAGGPSREAPRGADLPRATMKVLQGSAQA